MFFISFCRFKHAVLHTSSGLSTAARDSEYMIRKETRKLTAPLFICFSLMTVSHSLASAVMND